MTVARLPSISSVLVAAVEQCLNPEGMSFAEQLLISVREKSGNAACQGNIPLTDVLH